MGHQEIRQTAQVTTAAQDLLRQVFEKFSLSARSYDRIIKVARTIADLGNDEKIRERHIAEAVSYRNSLPRM
jgi:magnesium chelatase family protein